MSKYPRETNSMVINPQSKENCYKTPIFSSVNDDSISEKMLDEELAAKIDAGVNNDFVVNYTATQNGITCDKTFSEIKAAHNAGKNIKLIFNTGVANQTINTTTYSLSNDTFGTYVFLYGYATSDHLDHVDIFHLTHNAQNDIALTSGTFSADEVS